MFKNSSFGLAVLFLLGSGCNNDKSKEKVDPPTPMPAPVPAVVAPVPVAEPVVEPPAVTRAVRGERYALLDARDGAGTVVSLSIAGQDVIFRAESVSDTATSRKMKIIAVFGDVEQEVSICDLPKTPDSGAELLVGADGAAHATCTKGPHEKAPGFMEGKRLQWNDDRSQLLESGSWSGEGVVDVDSLELDEGGDDYFAE